MGIETDIYIGFTIGLELNEQKDYEFYRKIVDEYPELDKYNSKVHLVIDGMNGDYARLIFIEKKIDGCYCDELDYFKVNHNIEIPEEIYSELNKYYKVIMGDELSRDKIDYAIWAHWY